tara:strand:+ start:190 stop:309 length:120 start_codon:yes stop_codon:yes gene_type:complete
MPTMRANRNIIIVHTTIAVEVDIPFRARAFEKEESIWWI